MEARTYWLNASGIALGATMMLVNPAMAAAEEAEPGERATSGYIDPSTEQALWQLIGIRDACARSEKLQPNDVYRYERHRATVEGELAGLRDLAAKTEDADLKLQYAKRAAVLDEELKAVPKQVPDNCLDDDGRFRKEQLAFEARVDAFVERYDESSTGIGFQRDGAPGSAEEYFAAETPAEITRYGVGADFTVDDFRFWGSYAGGESYATATIPNTFDSGIVYGELSPGGSSGIAAPFGLDARIEEEQLTWAIGFGYQFDFAGGVDPGGLTASATPYVEFSRTTREIRASASASGTFGGGGFVYDFSQTRDQYLRDDRYEAGIKIDLSWQTESGFSFGIDGTAAAYAYQTSLDSLEQNRNNFTGAPDNAFDVSIRDEEDGVGFHGGFGIWAAYDLGGGVSFGVRGGYDHRSDVGGVFNPYSGDQVFLDGRRTEIDHRESDTKELAAELIFTW